MKFHYKGKYDMNPDSIPCKEHMPGAIAFKEPKDAEELGKFANKLAVKLLIVFLVIVIIRCRHYLLDSEFQFIGAMLCYLLLPIPHEFLHAICFKEDVYLYTNFENGIIFVTGPETMSKKRFVFLLLLPSVLLGLVPFIIGLVFPKCVFAAVFGAVSLGAGAGDYYNAYNALTQMPKGARTYMHKFNSYWYMP